MNGLEVPRVDDLPSPRVEDELDELLLELGLHYVGVGRDADGQQYLRFRIDREKNDQSDVPAIGQQAVALLSTARSDAIRKLWESSPKGIVVE